MPMTREGLKSWAEIEAGLRAAGYPGPYDEASMLAAFERAGGQTPGYRPANGGLGGLADAAASGNREQYAAALRQQFIDTYGYDPGPQYGYGGYGQSGASGGGYQTANGPKSLDQMRQELRSAGYPNWEQANEQEIVAVYGQTTGGPVSGGGSSGGGGARGDAAQGPNAGLAARIKDVYRQMIARKGVPALPPDDPDLIQAVSVATQLSPEQARTALQAGKTYYERLGQEITDDALGQIFNRAMPFGQNPSIEAREFERRGGRDQEDDHRWRESFGEGQYQYDTSQYGDFAKALLSAATSLRGPRDYAKYQQMLGNGKDILSQLRGDTPQQDFGMAGEPEPARVTDILEGLGIGFKGRNSRRPGIPVTGVVDEEDYFERMRSGARVGPRIDALSGQEAGSGAGIGATRRTRRAA